LYNTTWTRASGEDSGINVTIVRAMSEIDLCVMKSWTSTLKCTCILTHNLHIVINTFQNIHTHTFDTNTNHHKCMSKFTHTHTLTQILWTSWFIYICTRANALTWSSSYICLEIHSHTHTRLEIYTHTQTDAIRHQHEYLLIYTCTSRHVCVYIYIYIFRCVLTQSHVYIHEYIITWYIIHDVYHRWAQTHKCPYAFVFFCKYTMHACVRKP